MPNQIVKREPGHKNVIHRPGRTARVVETTKQRVAREAAEHARRTKEAAAVVVAPKVAEKVKP
jgi:hypothetical protein